VAAVARPFTTPIRGPLSVAESSDRPYLDPREHRILILLSTRSWSRPMDVGGRNSSNHHYRLTKLVQLGLVERRYRTSFSKPRYRNRIHKSFEYIITEAGKAWLNHG